MSIAQWNDANNTGHARIDQHHRQLLELIEQLEDAYSAGAPLPQLARQLSEAYSRLRQHLEEEEQLRRQGSQLPHLRAASSIPAALPPASDPDSARDISEGLNQLLAWAAAHLFAQAAPAPPLWQQALHTSRDRLRALCVNLPNLLWIQFSPKLPAAFSPRWQQLRRDSRRRAAAGDWQRDIHPDDQAGREAALARSRQSGAGFRHDYRLKAQEGNYRWLREVAIPMPESAAGGHLRYCVDIDEDKRHEQALRQALAEKDQHYRELSNQFHTMRQLHEEADLPVALARVAQLLPGCLRHPRHAAARIRYQERTYHSPGFNEASPWQLHAPLLLQGRPIGHLELIYHTLPPDRGPDRPFTTAEHQLFLQLKRMIGDSLRKRLDIQQAQLAHQRFELATENADDAVFIVDAQGGYLYVNPAACAMTGYDKATLERMHLSALCMEHELEAQLGAFQQLKHNGRLRQDMALKHRDGHPVMVEMNAVRLPDGQCFASCRDISARKQSETALRASEERFRTIVEASGDGILLADSDSLKLVFANRALCEMLGYSPAELAGINLGDLEADAGEQRLPQCLRLPPGGRASTASGIALLRRDGRAFFADLHCSSIHLGDASYTMGVLHDVSDRREAERMLKRHLDILSLLSTLSTELTNEVDALWEHLPAILERVGRFLGADHSFLLQPSHSGNHFCYGSGWHQQAGPPPDRLTPREDLGWLEERLNRNGAFAISDLTPLPQRDELPRLLGVAPLRALMVAPLRQQQELRGILVIAASQDARHWLWMESRMLQSVADLLASAIERHHRTRELQDSRRRLLEAQRIAHIGNWEWDVLNDTLFWSDQTYAILGLAPHQAQPDYPRKLARVHPDDIRPLRATLKRALKKGAPFSVEHRILRPDGCERIIRVQAILECDAGERVSRMAGTVQDITESKQIESRLRQSAVVYENTIEGVIITDSALRILDVNRAFTQITGYERAEILGKTPRILHSGKHDKSFYRQMWHGIREHNHWQGEVWDRRKDGSVFPEWLTITTVRSDAGKVTNYVGVFSDISQIKQSASDMEHLAHYDSLTGLPNRLLFLSRLGHAIQTAKREQLRVAIMFIDLDNFKQVNDTRGHSVGDKLLIEVAERLKTCMRANDTVSRVGGDEFLVLLENQKADYPVIDIASKIAGVCAQPFHLEGLDMTISCSIGICLYPRDGLDAETLLRNADTAMYQAKSEGKGCFRFYTEELTRRAMLRVHMEQELRMALERKELYLAFQPKYQLDNGKLVGAEALLRWQHPTLGLIGPETFIPLAEETGQIIPIGSWIIERACQLIRGWLDAGLVPGVISINIAGPQIHRAPIHQTLSRALADYRVSPEHIDLEVTENFIMHNPEDSLRVLNSLRELGVSLSIDDFGTGYSSLSYLKQLPIQTLKIDQSFIRGLPFNENDSAITQAIISLASALKLQLVAEGIENDAQRRFLIDAGCQYGQGYLYARPMPPEAFANLLRIGGVPIPYPH
ncbi:hypothetical protein CEK28_04455 [Xenophilus sp. AP218F]|nr:hypothetical protein CEK28_04455 [Xenophilus sp. AP218F]